MGLVSARLASSRMANLVFGKALSDQDTITIQDVVYRAQPIGMDPLLAAMDNDTGDPRDRVVKMIDFILQAVTEDERPRLRAHIGKTVDQGLLLEIFQGLVKGSSDLDPTQRASSSDGSPPTGPTSTDGAPPTASTPAL